MTKQFLVTAKVLIPYPKTISVRVAASSLGTALSRGWRDIRKELKSKRISTVTITASTL